MARCVTINDDNLVGCRVKVWWPKEESFCEGVVSSHSHSGKNLGNQKHHRAHAASDTVPEMDAAKEYGEELVGCNVKIWRSESKTFCEGVIASYNHSHKKHLVVYNNGSEEMLDLRKQSAEDVCTDQAPKKAHSPARDSSSICDDDDIDAYCHVGKKHKGQSFDFMSASASPKLPKDQGMQKLESRIAPIDSTLSAIPGEDTVLNVNGYKVRASAAHVLEAIFTRYGDIAAHCIYKSTSVKASLLEVVCNVVQRLQYHDIEAVLSNLEVIENEVSDVEASKIDVSWLKEHLAKLHTVVAFREKSTELRRTKAKSGFVTLMAAKELKQRRAELRLAQERFKEAERRVSAMRVVSRKIEDDIMQSEAEEYLWRRRLDDLV